MCFRYDFNEVMRELIACCNIQMFVRLDNKHLYIRLSVETPKKEFIIDIGNLLREANYK